MQVLAANILTRIAIVKIVCEWFLENWPYLICKCIENTQNVIETKPEPQLSLIVKSFLAKMVVHILYVSKDVFQKDLEPMLQEHTRGHLTIKY